MRTNYHSPRSGTSTTAATSELLVAVGLLASVFALLLAASYPAVTVAAVAGAASVVVLEAVVNRARDVCVPGTEVCLRPAP